LRECKQRPWDDAPRLVLADWFEENGENRAEQALAELIRVCCSCPRRDPFASRAWPTERERELLQEYASDWLGGLVGQVRWQTDRGLFNVGCLANTLAAGSAERPALAEGWALVNRVGLLGANDKNIARAVASPLLEEAGTLDLTGVDLRTKGWENLFAARIPQLLGFVLGESDLRHPLLERQLEDLLALPALAGLRRVELRLDSGEATSRPSLVNVITRWPGLANLTTLTLSLCRIGDVGAQMLAVSPGLAQVGFLGLAYCHLTDEGLRELVKSPYLQSLRWLDLWGNRGITSAGIAALMESDLPLTGLVLGETAIGHAGMEVLAHSPWTSRLTHLDLCRAGVNRESARLLARSPHLGGIKALRVGRVGYDEETHNQVRERFGELVEDWYKR
jgi:uncharacterized protein (TIGR02996 family)